jgi:hypothetical protein
MSCVPPRRNILPVDREAWRRTRDARRKVLDKVRARRRLMMEQRQKRDALR